MSAIPQELRDLDQWVVWKLEERDGEPTKVPYRAADPTVKASSTDPATWSSYETAVDAWKARDHDLAGPQRLDGIGFCLCSDDPYTGVDLDDCLDGTTMHPAAEAIVDLLGSFTEISPSGTGVKIIVRASKNGNGRCRTKKTPWGGEIEVYDTGRFWTITERPWGGTQGAIEEAQTQLGTLLAHFLPAEVATAASARPTQPVALDDRELLERMFAAKNGDKIKRLWNGDLSDYADDHSGADLGLCDALAFWTGCDPARMESMFSDSALGQRDKWTQRADYRLRTIEKAIEGCSEVYEPPAPTNSSGRRSSELVADSAPQTGPRVDYFFDASTLREEASRRSSSGQSENFFDATEEVPNKSLIRVEEIHAFAAVDEPGAEPLLGDDEVCVLALDGTMTSYGTGGAAKTTTAVDRSLHYAAGEAWLGLAVSIPRRVLIVENEGPRGRFRKKLEAKLAAWTGSLVEDRVHVLSEPWALLRFDNPQLLAELTERVDALQIDVVVAGPIKRLGLQGGGTPEEVQAFMLLLESVKAQLGRPLAYDLTHHTNKAGSVSGDWEGTGDTLIRLDKRGPNASTLTWEKVRWGGSLQGSAWKLKWLDGERFEIDETPERTEEDIVADLLAFVEVNPGTTWTPCQKALKGTAAANVAVRDQLLEAGELVNTGAAKQGAPMHLYLPEQAPATDQATLEET